MRDIHAAAKLYKQINSEILDSLKRYLPEFSAEYAELDDRRCAVSHLANAIACCTTKLQLLGGRIVREVENSQHPEMPYVAGQPQRTAIECNEVAAQLRELSDVIESFGCAMDEIGCQMQAAEHAINDRKAA